MQKSRPISFTSTGKSLNRKTHRRNSEPCHSRKIVIAKAIHFLLCIHETPSYAILCTRDRTETASSIADRCSAEIGHSCLAMQFVPLLLSNYSHERLFIRI
mmetsp:Transcript_17791/g.41052  ORF Transcript_17791/g.41052 Transcript_17791/m.41052 type:complete len:101 (-) Transcript_17791:165-467(-)